MKLFSRPRISMVLAEFLGTTLLTIVALTVGGSDVATPYFVAAAVGAMLALNIVLFGAISGSHVNPAITIALLSMRKIRFEKALVFIAAQMLGAIAALRLHLWLTDSPVINFSFGTINWKIFAAELAGAFLFSIVVASAFKRGYQGISLAGAVGTAMFLGIVVSSAVPVPLETRINARNQGSNVASHKEGTINPALAIGRQNFGWEYVLAPVAGAVIGMNAYNYLFAGSDALFLTGRRSRRLDARSEAEASPVVTKRTVTKKKPAATSRKKK